MKRVAGLVALLGMASVAGADVYQNLAPLPIPGAGTAGGALPYPSVISIAGWSGSVSSVRVTLFGLSHSFPDDLDILLVGPSGQTVLLMSDVGGATDAVNIDLVFEDGGIAMPDSTALLGGVYAPTDYEAGDILPGPAPRGPFGSSLLTAFGTSVNGAWSLFASDDAGADVGQLAGGWQIEVVPSPSAIALMGVGGLVAMRRRR